MVTITRGAWWSKTTPKRINGAVHLVWVFSHRHWMQELLVDHPEGVVGWHCSSWGGRPGQLWLMGQWISRKVVLSWKGWHFWCASVWANLTLIALKTHQRWRLGFPMTIRYLAPTAALLVWSHRYPGEPQMHYATMQAWTLQASRGQIGNTLSPEHRKRTHPNNIYIYIHIIIICTCNITYIAQYR